MIGDPFDLRAMRVSTSNVVPSGIEPNVISGPSVTTFPSASTNCPFCVLYTSMNGSIFAPSGMTISLTLPSGAVALMICSFSKKSACRYLFWSATLPRTLVNGISGSSDSRDCCTVIVPSKSFSPLWYCRTIASVSGDICALRTDETAPILSNMIPFLRSVSFSRFSIPLLVFTSSQSITLRPTSSSVARVPPAYSPVAAAVSARISSLMYARILSVSPPNCS